MIVSVLGLEPRTNGLKGHCSTIELYAHIRTNISLAPLGGTVKTFSEIGLTFPARPARMVRLLWKITESKEDVPAADAGAAVPLIEGYERG